MWSCVNLNPSCRFLAVSLGNRRGNDVAPLRTDVWLNDEVQEGYTFFFFSLFLLRLTQRMGRKDASTSALPVDQYRKQIGESFGGKNKPKSKKFSQFLRDFFFGRTLN